MQEISELKSEAKVIDLTRDKARIFNDLRDSLLKEGQYDQFADLRCEIKWENGPSYPACEGCPHRSTDASEPLTLICALGHQQMGLLDELVAVERAEKLDAELTREHESQVALSVEIAATVL